MIIRSIIPNTKYEKSGIETKNNFYPTLSGFNLYFIDNKKEIIFENFKDTATAISRINKILTIPDIKYIIGIIDGENNININEISALGILNLQKIFKLKKVSAYYFLYNINDKKLLGEKISHRHLVADTFEYIENELVRAKNINIIVASDMYHPLTIEYFDNLKGDLNFTYIVSIDPSDYEYECDPYELYVFPISAAVTKNFSKFYSNIKATNKKFNHITLNFDQLTRTDKKMTLLDLPWIKDVPIIDYSIENIFFRRDLKMYYLPYQYNTVEIEFLKKAYLETPKIYDIAFCGTTTEYRTNILSQLENHGLKINYIRKWGKERDLEICKCRVLINIHCTQYFKIYESIRCDRWVFAGVPVISEDPIYLDKLDIKDLVYFYPYDKIVDGTILLLKNNNFSKHDDKIISIIKNTRKSAMELVIKELNKF